MAQVLCKPGLARAVGPVTDLTRPWFMASRPLGGPLRSPRAPSVLGTVCPVDRQRQLGCGSLVLGLGRELVEH